jgi:hypothetical protein
MRVLYGPRQYCICIVAVTSNNTSPHQSCVDAAGGVLVRGRVGAPEDHRQIPGAEVKAQLAPEFQTWAPPTRGPHLRQGGHHHSAGSACLYVHVAQWMGPTCLSVSTHAIPLRPGAPRKLPAAPAAHMSTPLQS